MTEKTRLVVGEEKTKSLGREKIEENGKDNNSYSNNNNKDEEQQHQYHLQEEKEEEDEEEEDHHYVSFRTGERFVSSDDQENFIIRSGEGKGKKSYLMDYPSLDYDALNLTTHHDERPDHRILPSILDMASVTTTVGPTLSTTLTTDHAASMVGGYCGHVFRRMYHITCFTVIPIFYYYGTLWFFQGSFLWPQRMVSGVCMLYLVVEVLRLTWGLTCFGMRSYESRQLSGNAWGVFSLSMVFLLVPKTYGSMPGSLGIPMAWSLAFGDPVLGEARNAGLAFGWMVMCGMIVVSLVWILCIIWLGTPWYLSFVMVPLTVASELPKINFIDDNGMMLLLPLSCLLLLQPWIP